MGKEYNELNKRFQTLISKKESFEEGKEILLELRKNMYDMLMLVKKGFNPTGFSLMPFKNSNGYESKTMAYSIYHIIRIEDIVCHTLIKNDEQVFEKNDYQKRLGIDIKSTGNELNKEEVGLFSKKINLSELYNYLNDVYFESNEMIKELRFDDLKRKISSDKKDYLLKSSYVSNNESAVWLIDYWCNKNVLGLLKMPFSRHWIMHVDAFLKIKNKLIQNAKKETKNKISVCGFSCNHCFLYMWCGSCRSEYNCCSYGTLFEGNVCPNVKCAKEKGYEGCYDCPNLDSCEVGFYKKDNDDGIAAKTNAMFIRQYGKKNLVLALDEMHKHFDYKKMQEMVAQNKLEILVKYMKDAKKE